MTDAAQDDEGLERAEQQERAADAETLRQLMKVFEFGLLIREFITGPIGQRLLSDADEQRVSLVQRYLALDPDYDKARPEMRELRLKLHVLDHWQDELARYMQDGDAAEKQLEAMEEPLSTSG